MSELQSISDGKVVQIHYTLTNDAGETLDSSAGQEPLAYLHGAQNIVPGLERQLEGHVQGDKLKASVPPEEAYGELQGEGPQSVPRNEFPEEIEIAPGMTFQVEGEQGEPFLIWVVNVAGEEVLVDINHPLAGVQLNFDIEVVDIRPATQEEIDHGHPHTGGEHHP